MNENSAFEQCMSRKAEIYLLILRIMFTFVAVKSYMLQLYGLNCLESSTNCLQINNEFNND